MDGLLQILVLVGFLVGGALLARFKIAPKPRAVDALIKAALWALLFAMGFRIGNDRGLSSRLGELGLLAAATAVLAVLGTIAALLVVETLFLRNRRPTSNVARSAGPSLGWANFKSPALLLAIVLAGFLLGLLIPDLDIDISAITSWALNGLLFFIGMQFIQAGVSMKGAFLKPEVLVVPLATAMGSLAGSLVLVPLFHISAGKALALASGFGWYSLSGVLISDMGDPALGSAAFLANMIRESIAFLAIPFLARSRMPALAVGVGGATAMDVTLPLIEQCAGPEIVPLSFTSGALLSLAVPVLVPFFFRLG